MRPTLSLFVGEHMHPPFKIIPLAVLLTVAHASAASSSPSSPPARTHNLSFGVAADTQPPSVVISSPGQGARLRDTVAIVFLASDNVGVMQVDVYDGTRWLGSSSSSPSIIWNTRTVTDGTHTLIAKAYDAARNVGTSASVTVTVDNQAPNVSITAPSSGALLRGAVSIAATASDDIGVTKVEFYERYTLLGSISSPPYVLNWVTTWNGTGTLIAKAYDATGNVGTSTSVVVTVDNQAPGVVIDNPVNGSVLEGPITLTARASDNREVVRVEFYDGTTLLGSVTAPPYTLTWDTDGVAPGEHWLSARAYDAAGNVGTSANVGVRMNDVAPPTLTFVSPEEGATVDRYFTVTVDAMDNVGVSRVDFVFDGVLLGQLTQAPWSWSHQVEGGDTSSAPHTVTVIAYDEAGNASEPITRSVFVASDDARR